MRVFLTLAFCLPLLCSTAQQENWFADQLQAIEQSARQDPRKVLEHLKQVREQCRRNDELLTFLELAKKAGVALDLAGHLDLAMEAYQQGSEVNLFRPPQSNEEWIALGWLYTNAAYTQAWYGHYLEASKWYEKARKVFEEKARHVDATVVAYVHRELGNIYTRFGDHAAAMVLLERTHQVALQHENYNLAAEALNDIAIAQADRGLDSLAALTCQRALSLPDLSAVSRCLLESTLALTLSRQGLNQPARHHARSGLGYCQQVVRSQLHPSGRYWLSNLHKQLGELSESPREAFEHFNQALALLRAHFPDTLRREVAKVHLLMAERYLQMQAPQQALFHQQAALRAVLYRFDADDPAVNPDPAFFYPENTIIEALHGKARSWKLLYEQTRQIPSLDQAIDCFKLAFEAARIYRRVHHFESSSLAVVEENNQRTAEALDLVWKRYRLDPSPKWLELAFDLAEQNRSVLLLEALRNSTAGSIANLPDSLLLAQRELEVQIAELDKAIFFQQRNPQSNPSEIDSLQQLAFQLRTQLQEIEGQMEASFPAIHQLRYGRTQLFTADIADLLTPDQAFISYFPASGRLFVFLVKKDTALWLRLPLDFELDDAVLKFRRHIEDFQFFGKDKAALCIRYTEAAGKFYDVLLRPLEPWGLPQRLLIVPGGVLGYLPFSALLYETPPPGCRLSKYPFVVRRHAVGYTYSAGLFQQLSHKQPNATGKGLAMAPAFDGSHGFGVLHFNVSSAQEVARLMGGKALTHGDANLANFRALAPNQPWLYLATHAQANAEAGDFSFIALAGQDQPYDSLFARDIYTMQLEGGLVWLGACETGRGSWYRSEGIISLARAFLYAGARSVVTTLWSINDETNSRLTKTFFRHFKQGLPAALALQRAQLSIIDSATPDVYAHPVYWSAYSLIGVAPTLPGKPMVGWLLAGAAVLLAGVGFWFWQNRLAD